MKRRGFLRALVGAAMIPVVSKVIPSYLTSADPKTTYQSFTFKRNKSDFDVVTYTGDGSKKELMRTGFDPSLIIIKCIDAVQPWYILTSNSLIPELNKPGLNYVAYEFAGETADKVSGMINNSEHFIRV